MLRLLVVMLAACGRIGFEAATGDATGVGPCVAGHDEDQDGVDDCVDSCPHLPDRGAPDDDGDGIANTCDPGTAAQRRAFFSPLTGPSPFSVTFTGNGVWTNVSDALHYNGVASTTAALPVAVRDVDIWIGARVSSFMPPAQIAIALDSGTGPYYYIEVYAPGGAGPFIAVSRFDGTMYAPVFMGPIGDGFPAAAMTLRLGVRAPGAQMMGVLTQSLESRAFADVPGYTGSPQLTVNVSNVVLDLEYIFVLETPGL